MDKIDITIGEKTYTVGYPTVEQLIEIEDVKLLMTNGKYIDYTFSALKNHVLLLDIADAVGYLSVLIPDLKSDLGLEDWKKASAPVIKPVIKAYKEKFIPWYKPISEDLYNFDKDDESTEEKTGE